MSKSMANKVLHVFAENMFKLTGSDDIFVIKRNRKDMVVLGSTGEVLKFDGDIYEVEGGVLEFAPRDGSQEHVILDLSNNYMCLDDAKDGSFLRHTGNSYLASTFGYAGVLGGVNVYHHHILALCKYGIEMIDKIDFGQTGLVVDHKNLNKRDNSFENLDLVTRQVNSIS